MRPASAVEMFADVVHADAVLSERLAAAAVGAGATVFVPTDAALRDFTNDGNSILDLGLP